MRALLAALGFALVPPALGCGVCIEDKIAAAYDHAVIAHALERRQSVVFFGIEGALPAGSDVQRKLRAAAQSVAGVEGDTVRVSIESASLSFAFDQARHPLGPILRALNRKLAASGLNAFPLRVVDSAPARR
jgi:hypothetical protein